MTQHLTREPAWTLVRLGGLTFLALLSSMMFTPAVNADTTSLTTWHQEMSQTPTPGAGCYTAAYPSLTWQSTTCVTPPSIPFTVGNGCCDSIGNAPSGGVLGNVEGYVSSESGYSSEKSTGGSGVPSSCNDASNCYSIQVNTNMWSNSSSTCSSTSGVVCYWEQFIFDYNYPTSGEGQILMQFWILYGGALCSSYPYSATYWPNGWQGSSGACFINSAAVTVPNADTPQYLYDYSLDGNTIENTIGGNPADSMVFCDSVNCYSTGVPDALLGLQSNWEHVEWNVFGLCCSAQAQFSGTGTSGTDLHNEVKEWNGNGNAFSTTTSSGSYTSETNNLNDYSTVSGYSGYYTFSECQTTPC